MSNLQKSSPNSCCKIGFHGLVTGLEEPEPEPSASDAKLDVLGRFGGRSIFSKGADNKSGLGAGDGVPVVLQPAVG